MAIKHCALDDGSVKVGIPTLQQVRPQVGQMAIQPGLHALLIHSVNARRLSAT
ncbi:hypothetical protein NKH45_35750 [Mesorhizobium sp. M1156]|uniref:hypothetical protein n=1 Tax=Mesorhizobium sp. M1156 TaxID=2957064 RepID=UPI0033392C30